MGEKKLIDLDEMEGAIIAVTYEGKVRSLSKPELLKLLALEAKVSSAKGMPSRRLNLESEGRNLNSLGKRVANVFDEYRKKRAIPEEKCTYLIELMDEFDGDVSGKRSTQIYHHMTDMEKWNISKELKAKIVEFLEKYDVLKIVPKKV